MLLSQRCVLILAPISLLLFVTLTLVFIVAARVPRVVVHHQFLLTFIFVAPLTQELCEEALVLFDLLTLHLLHHLMLNICQTSASFDCILVGVSC